MLLWLTTVLLDASIVVGLAWLVRRTERRQTRAVATERRRLDRLRGQIEDLMTDVERRTRALDQALAMREATLRVLAATSAEPREAATALLDAGEVRLLRDLELSLEPAAESASRAAAR